MHRFLTASTLLSLSALAACNMGGERNQSGQCPAGELCSPLTPDGLLFLGNPVAGVAFSTLAGPPATAIGGTQDIALEYDRGDGVEIALDLPYKADDDGGLGVEVEGTQGSVVKVRGVASRENYLRIVDLHTNELFDRYKLAGAELETIELIGTEYEKVPTDRTAIVWATGDQEIGISLAGKVQEGNTPVLERIVDTSMELSMPSATRIGWDRLRVANATVGINTLLVTAGDKPAAPFTVEFVSGADSMLVLDDPTPSVAPNSSTSVCFAAMNGDRYVYGLTWQFNVGGVASTKGKDSLSRNCVNVSASGMTTGSIQVAAAAGGVQKNVTVTIGAATRDEAAVRPGSIGSAARLASPLGERAALAE